MSKAYPTLLSPLKIRNKLMPNRMGFARAVPIFTCGTNDLRPLDTMAVFSGDMARNGAGIVALPAAKFPLDFERGVEFIQIHHSAADPEGEEDESGFRPPEPGEMQGLDMSLDEVQIKFARAVEAIHDEGALACASMMDIEPFGWTLEQLSGEQIEKMLDNFVKAAKIYYGLGCDILHFYMSDGMSILGMSLSPVFNTRTDEYGGKTMTERAALTKELFRRVRKACPNVIIEAKLFTAEKVPGGYTFEDAKEYLRAVEGYLDIVQLHTNEEGSTYLDEPNRQKPVSIKYAAELKKLGLAMVIAPAGGFWDPRENETYLAAGMCDFIYMGRPFLSNAEYGRKVKEGRAEDIVPCLRCNKCHSQPNNPDGGCTVNPQLYLSVSDRENWKIVPARVKKNVAVIGGGPAGMEAAIVASRRGHSVTLYEMDNTLGGQLLHSDYFSFKWSLKEFKDYMIAQVKKSGTRLMMGVKATPELLAKENYDVIVLAAGAECKTLHIPGADRKNVWRPTDVCGHEGELGKKVVVVGGAETGCEYGLHLALSGIDTTVLTRRNRLANDAHPIHYREFLMARCRGEEKFHYITKAKTVEILPNGVKYLDTDGKEQIIEADSVIVSAGVAPRQDDAMGFAALADEFYCIGDCRDPKDVRRAMKNAFCAAIRM